MPLVQRGGRFCAGCRKPIPRSQQEIAHLQNLVPDQCSGGHGTGLTRHLATPGVQGGHGKVELLFGAVRVLCRNIPKDWVTAGLGPRPTLPYSFCRDGGVVCKNTDEVQI